ncbi:glycine--tRNA ligase subunit beta, partial [Sphingomonas sp.]|uniref:glycine--tRNA ligase subunit beta n=1 Tax=Sphingomonas sp. TaxID=28214 RepID=UPI00286B440F
DKIVRVAKLAEWLVTEGIVKGCSPADAKRAAELCKADLVTGMVGEFPELQGVIGGHLARAQGEPDAIANAIRDHYKPVGQGDDVPTAPVTVAVSLADKLDSLVAFFFYGEVPTGSKDPFALRRSALGAIRVLIENEVRLPLLTLADFSIERLSETWKKNLKGSGGLLRGKGTRTGLGEHDSQSFELLDFFADRLKVQQREAGVRHDLIDAVFALGGEDDLVRLLARVKALQAFVETGEGGNLLIGYKRAANILKREEGSWTPDHVRGDGDMASEEAALAAALDIADPTATAAIQAEDFTAAMSALASLRAPIDAFFEHVIVNDPDLGVRARRLSLLARFRDAVHAVADFSKIGG